MSEPPSLSDVYAARSWKETIRQGLGYILTRSALLAVGAGIAIITNLYGQWIGYEQGFLAGCEAALGSDAEMCRRSAALGHEVTRLRSQLPTPKQDQLDEADRLCRALIGAPPEVLAHYGCVEPHS